MPVQDVLAESKWAGVRNKNVFRILVYCLIDGAAYSIWSQQVYPVLIEQLAGDTAVGWMSAASGVAQMIAAVVAGVWGDRLKREHVLRAGALAGFCAVLLTMAGIAKLHIAVLYVSQTLWGTYSGIAATGTEALYADSVATGRRAFIYNVKWMDQTLSSCVGLVATIILLVRMGNKWEQHSMVITMYVGLCVHPLAMLMLCMMRDKYALKEDERGDEASAVKGQQAVTATHMMAITAKPHNHSNDDDEEEEDEEDKRHVHGVYQHEAPRSADAMSEEELLLSQQNIVTPQPPPTTSDSSTSTTSVIVVVAAAAAAGTMTTQKKQMSSSLTSTDGGNSSRRDAPQSAIGNTTRPTCHNDNDEKEGGATSRVSVQGQQQQQQPAALDAAAATTSGNNSATVTCVEVHEAGMDSPGAAPSSATPAPSCISAEHAAMLVAHRLERELDRAWDRYRAEMDAADGLLPRLKSSMHFFLTLVFSWEAVPYLVCLTDFLVSFGSGMTLRYLLLYFVKDYGTSPSLMMTATLITCPLQALFSYAVQYSGDYYVGRVSATIYARLLGAGLLLIMGFTHLPLWLVLPIYVVRNAVTNSVRGVSRSVIMDAVKRENRAKWSAFESFSSFTWAGSATIGGYIAEAKGYQYTFNITSYIHIAAMVVLLPAVFGSRPVEQELIRAKTARRAERRARAQVHNDAAVPASEVVIVAHE